MGLSAVPIPATLHRSVFNSLEDQIAVIDRAGIILEVNSAWLKFGAENGLDSEHLFAGVNYLDTLSDASVAGDSHAGEALKGITDVLAGRLAFFSFEYPCHSPDEKRWFTMRINALQDGDSKDMFVVSHHNITQRKLAEERVEQMAMQDPLTGLANRRAFLLFLNRELRANIRNQAPIALAVIDIDYFKDYNDEFGHASGDQCLKNVSQVLLAHARRPGDLAARIGGDEFALILANTEPEPARLIAESVLKAINEAKMSFGGSKRITLSIGLLSAAPHDQQSEDHLLQQADKALYRAKTAGKNRVVSVQLGANGQEQPAAPRDAAR